MLSKFWDSKAICWLTDCSAVLCCGGERFVLLNPIGEDDMSKPMPLVGGGGEVPAYNSKLPSSVPRCVSSLYFDTAPEAEEPFLCGAALDELRGSENLDLKSDFCGEAPASPIGRWSRVIRLSSDAVPLSDIIFFDVSEW